MKKLGVVLIALAMAAMCGCVKQVPPEADVNAAYEETYSGTVVEVFTEGSGEDTAQVLKVRTQNDETIHFTVTEETALLWQKSLSGNSYETTLDQFVKGIHVEVECRSFQNSGYHPAITVTGIVPAPGENCGCGGEATVLSPCLSETPLAGLTPQVAVRVNGELIAPYVHLGSSTTWDGQYWLCADGLALENVLPEVAGDIPSFTYSEDYELLVGEKVTLSGPATYQVYNTDFELLRLYLPADDLTDLPEGSHIIVLGVQEQGDYIASEEAYEEFWYQCAYLVEK